MVKNTPKKITRHGDYTYERAGATINKAAHLLAARWSHDFRVAEDKEKYLFGKLHELADYLDAAFDDHYLKNLYYHYVGGFRANDSLEDMLKKMESIRLSIVRALKSGTKKVPPQVKTQHVYDGRKIVKWKFLIRLMTAQHIAQLLYMQYRRQRKLNSATVPKQDSITATLPGMTAWYIRELLPKQKKG